MDLVKNEKISNIIEIVLSGLLWFVITAFIVKIYQSLNEKRNNTETDETEESIDYYATGKKMSLEFNTSIKLSK